MYLYGLPRLEIKVQVTDLKRRCSSAIQLHILIQFRYREDEP